MKASGRCQRNVESRPAAQGAALRLALRLQGCAAITSDMHGRSHVARLARSNWLRDCTIRNGPIRAWYRSRLSSTNMNQVRAYPHILIIPGFGPTVCMVSLLDDWEMDFSENWKDKSPALLQRGSCVLMTDEARHVWAARHCSAKERASAVGKAGSEPPIVTDVQDGAPSRNSDRVAEQFYLSSLPSVRHA